MENKNIQFVVAIILSFFSIDSYCRGCENMIESIDSAIVYMPINDEYRIILKSCYEPKTKDVLLYEINAQNISPRKYDHNNHPEILDSIKSYINNSIEIDTLSYNTSQLIKYTPSDIRPNYVGVIWNTEGKDLDALVILFIKNEIELLWIGLDYVEYKNLRIKCDIFKLLKKHAV